MIVDLKHKDATKTITATWNINAKGWTIFPDGLSYNKKPGYCPASCY
jgi:hypothetical protein